MRYAFFATELKDVTDNRLIGRYREYGQYRLFRCLRRAR